MIVSIINTKGGVGKTTVAIHVATLFSRIGPTLLIDSDIQASAASWAAWRRETQHSSSPVTVCLMGKAVFNEGKTLSTNYQYTVVDAGGRDSHAFRSALLLSDVSIVPIGASSLDTSALTDVLTVVDEARDFNPKVRVKALMNRIDTRTKDTSELQAFLEEHHIPVFNTRVCERVAFRRSVNQGCIVHEFGKDPAAITEIDNLMREIDTLKKELSYENQASH
jgi:chromosome partitioning protein